MKITDLDARFVGGYHDNGYRTVPTIDGAQGVLFQCPKCGEGLKHGGGEEDGTFRHWIEGDHYVLCWFRNPRNAPTVPDNIFPGPGRWTASGDGLENLTLSPSVDCTPKKPIDPNDFKPCMWHGWVENGDAR